MIYLDQNIFIFNKSIFVYYTKLIIISEIKYEDLKLKIVNKNNDKKSDKALLTYFISVTYKFFFK